MFFNATVFNQDLTKWCVIQIPKEPNNFAMATFGTGNRPHWWECETFDGKVRPFVMTVNTQNVTAGNRIVYLYTNGGAFNYTIDW